MDKARKLKRMNVTDTGNGVLVCKKCGQKWSPNVQPGGRTPRRYSQCPNGCNK